MKKDNATDIEIKYIQEDVKDIQGDVKYIKSEFMTRRDFETWTRESFVPMRNGFYAMIMLVVTGFLGAVINFFIRTPKP